VALGGGIKMGQLRNVVATPAADIGAQDIASELHDPRVHHQIEAATKQLEVAIHGVLRKSTPHTSASVQKARLHSAGAGAGAVWRGAVAHATAARRHVPFRVDRCSCGRQLDLAATQFVPQAALPQGFVIRNLRAAQDAAGADNKPIAVVGAALGLSQQRDTPVGACAAERQGRPRLPVDFPRRVPPPTLRLRNGPTWQSVNIETAMRHGPALLLPRGRHTSRPSYSRSHHAAKQASEAPAAAGGRSAEAAGRGNNRVSE
jgi:hypothetical protein